MLLSTIHYLLSGHYHYLEHEVFVGHLRGYVLHATIHYLLSGHYHYLEHEVFVGQDGYVLVHSPRQQTQPTLHVLLMGETDEGERQGGERGER